MTIADIWERFCCELVYVRNYSVIAGTVSAARPHRNPYLEEILPGLLLLKAAAIFDEGLAEHTGITNGTLDKRIKHLRDSGDLPLPYLSVDRVRLNRNHVAHEFPGTVSWTVLDEDVATISAVMSSLGIARQMPKLDIVGETRRLARDEADPNTSIHLVHEVRLSDSTGKLWGSLKYKTKC